jgi:hypothetical protein
MLSVSNVIVLRFSAFPRWRRHIFFHMLTSQMFPSDAWKYVPSIETGNGASYELK